MAIAAPPVKRTRGTLDELVARLGDIPLRRIWLDPPPGTATKQDVIDVEDRYNRHCELIDGT